jgi:ribonuclease G
MDRFNKTIQVKPQQNYHQEQFDIYGRQDRSEREERRRGQGRGQRGAPPVSEATEPAQAPVASASSSEPSAE